jgi:hypothetical protein
MRTPKLVVALNAVTATTTSSEIDVRGAKKVVILCTRANHSAGSTAFSVTGSIDKGTTYVATNIVDHAANTNAQTVTRSASKTLSANGTAWIALDLEYLAFDLIKVTATETTDGTHSASVYITY